MSPKTAEEEKREEVSIWVKSDDVLVVVMRNMLRIMNSTLKRTFLLNFKPLHDRKI